MYQDDSIWETWSVSGPNTIDKIKIANNKSKKHRGKKKNEHTKRSNKKHMGEI